MPDPDDYDPDADPEPMELGIDPSELEEVPEGTELPANEPVPEPG